MSTSISTLISRLSTSPFAIAAVVLAVAIYIYSKSFKLSHIPGPFLTRFTYLYETYHYLKLQEYTVYPELFRKYQSSVIRIGPDLVLFNDPAYIPTVFARGTTKGPQYEIVGGWGTFGIIDPEPHAKSRKINAMTLNAQVVEKKRAKIESLGKLWGDAIEKAAAENDGVVDIAELAPLFSMDVMFDLIAGVGPENIQAGKDVHGLVESGDKLLIINGLLQRWYNLLRFLKNVGIWGIMEPQPGDGSPVGVWMKYGGDMISKRLEERKRGKATEKADYLNHLLDYQGPHGALPPHEISGEVLSLMFGGIDSVAHSLLITIASTFTRPEIVEKIHATNFNTNYLSACTRESLRLTPPLNGVFSRLAPPGGIYLGKHYIPEGTAIAAESWSLQRNPKVWGNDADEFRPERWLVPGTRELLEGKEMRELDSALMVWGAGSRNCLGRRMAELEMEYALNILVRRFEMEVVEVGEMEVGIMTKYKGGVKMRVRRREQAVA